MSERSFILPGSELGDGTLAPMASEDLADWMFFAFEWYPSTDIGYRSDFPSDVPNTFFKPVDGYSVPIRGAVIDSVGTGNLRTFYSGTPNWIEMATGWGIFDGRIFQIDTGSLLFNVPTPPSGTRYYAIGVKVDSVAQTARGYRSDAQTSISAIYEIWNSVRKSSNYFAPLAIAKITSAGAITTFDLRRIIHTTGLGAVSVAWRQGGSQTDWSVPGTNNYRVRNEAAVLPFKVGTGIGGVDDEYYFRPKSGFANYPIGFANGRGANAYAMAQVYPVAEPGNVCVHAYTRDTSKLAAESAAGFIIGNGEVNQLAVSGFDPIPNTVDEDYAGFSGNDKTYNF